MNAHRISILLIVGVLISLALFLPGCDKLITEVNNITLIDTTLGKECKSCHTDKNDQLIVIPKAQWANSAHSDPSLLEYPVMLNGQLKTATACGAACHSGDAYVDSILTGHPSDTTHPSTINCYTCHLPHSVPTDAGELDSLRGISLAVTLADGESKYLKDPPKGFGKSTMCANCHKATGAPPNRTTTSDITLTANFGPHYSAQADVVNGTGGYRFEDSTSLASSHTTPLMSDGCINCHFGKGKGYDLGEHTFRLQYHDAVHDTTPYVANCSGGTCHGSTSAASFYAVSSNTQSVPRGDSITHYADTLRYLLNKSFILHPEDTAGTMYTVGDILPADGARILYNYLLYRHDGSRGLHNPQLMNNLLRYSLQHWDSIAPRADFTISDNDVCVGDSVTFTNKSRFTYHSSEWTLGGGNFSIENSPTYAYDSAAVYSITLKVTNDSTNVNSLATKSNAITVHGPLTAQIDVDTTIVCLNSSVSFSDISSGISTSRQWYINGDTANITTGLTTSFTPTQWGPNNVRVVLRAFNNCTPGGDTVFQDFVIVADSTPVANFGWNPITVQTGVPVTFEDSSLGPARSWNWTFNLGQPDSSTSTQQNPTHTFTTVGTWQVRLTVENDCGKRAVTKSISVSSIAPSPVDVTPRSERKK